MLIDNNIFFYLNPIKNKENTKKTYLNLKAVSKYSVVEFKSFKKWIFKNVFQINL